MRSITTTIDEPAPYQAKPRGGGGSGPYYPATFRIPRPTHALLSEHINRHRLTLQGVLAEALDEWMRKHKVGTFLPANWEEAKKDYEEQE